MSEEQREVYRQFRQAQDKYVYFLLAAAGAGIGLAVNQTLTATLSWSQLPLACAVASWAASFIFGCRYVERHTSALFANMALLRVQTGREPGVGENPEATAAASQGIREALEKHSNRLQWLGNWQFRSLVLGAFFYLAWHVTEMALRTPNVH